MGGSNAPKRASKKHTDFRAIPCNSVLFRAIPCYSVQFRAIPCYSVQFRGGGILRVCWLSAGFCVLSSIFLGFLFWHSKTPKKFRAIPWSSVQFRGGSVGGGGANAPKRASKKHTRISVLFRAILCKDRSKSSDLKEEKFARSLFRHSEALPGARLFHRVC